MTADERKQLMIQQLGEEKVNELTAKIWLLIGSLNTSLFAIAQMEPRKMNYLMKKRFNDLRTGIKLFLNTFENSFDQREKEFLNSVSFDNVGAIAELIAMCAQVPSDELEWYLDQCKRLTFEAYNRNELRKKSGE